MSHTGRLLVATPLIGDPNFERTVVLVLAHNADGAFGVVLNRPSDLPVSEAVAGWADHAAAPGVVFIGGPVDPETVIGLAMTSSSLNGDDVGQATEMGAVNLNASPLGQMATPDGLRLFAGSAGWTSGQLEDEIAEGAWWPLDSHPGDITTTDPSHLWETVIRRQRSPLAWFANCPLDPSAN